MGYLFATLSLILVTIAQLFLKWSMIHLPPISQFSIFVSALFSFSHYSLILMTGIFFYFISTLIWIFTLKWLPLGRAYSLLSLSYILVWSIALFIPEFHENFSLIKFVGVLMIGWGIFMIFSF